MTPINLKQNPFQVLSPEDMQAQDVVAMFVDVFSQFYSIRNVGHSMLNGPRGSGKSMIFRYLLPDCQRLEKKACMLKELERLCVLVRFKNTVPNLTEFRRLESHYIGTFLNEHVLVLYIAIAVFDTCSKATQDLLGGNEEIRTLYETVYTTRLKLAGAKSIPVLGPSKGVSEAFAQMASFCGELYQNINQLAKRLFTPDSHPVYEGALCDYMGFLCPLLAAIRQLSFMPSGSIFLFLDDADYLSHLQTRIVNSWIATRTSADVSLKVSTQLRYKTFQTLSNIPIQSPHDFQEFDIADLYTSRISTYRKRVHDIVDKRLKLAGIAKEPEAFFPKDEEQEAQIRNIGEEIRKKWVAGRSGYRASDDVTRYSRPEYFKSLAGTAKSSHRYHYAGFGQLVDISSGVVRFFLDSAGQMFDKEREQMGETLIPEIIKPTTQDETIRSESDKLMFGEFTKIKDAECEYGGTEMSRSDASVLEKRILQLNSLIRVLGGTFRQKLLSDDSERRVFSVAISGTPNSDVIEVFELGVRYGYFHRSTIGNKEGTGRTRLYVMTRRLAPHFNLDPSSFAGYLFVTNEHLREAMEDPDKLLGRVKREGVDKVFDVGQLPLFDSAEDVSDEC